MTGQEAASTSGYEPVDNDEEEDDMDMDDYNGKLCLQVKAVTTCISGLHQQT